MTKYDIIVESLQARIDSGELTLEDAEIINSVAYEKYNDKKKEKELNHTSDSTVHGKKYNIGIFLTKVMILRKLMS